MSLTKTTLPGLTTLSCLTLLLCIALFSCYEPKEGCLDTDAVNYQVDTDDPCSDCCTYPKLSLQLQHRFELPDTTLSLRYQTFYPSTVDPLDSFLIDRYRFFISNLTLVRENGELVSVLDSLTIEAPEGTPVTVVDNFGKFDRDIFQARTLGKIITEGVFTQVRLTLGLEEFLLQTDPLSAPSDHPLNTSTDTIIYDDATGIIPNLLIFRRDTLPLSDTLEIRFTEPTTISLPLSGPFVVERGFNIKLTLKLNYYELFEGVDFQNDNLQTMKEKIANNFVNVFSVTGLTLE